MGTDILDDIPLHRLTNKADRWRYAELCALAKLSVNHTASNDEIGDLLAGYSDPLKLEEIARKMEESPRQIEAFLSRVKEAMPRAIIMREGRYHLANYAKRQYDYPCDMPHSGPTQAPLRPHSGPTQAPLRPRPKRERDMERDMEERPPAPCAWCSNPTDRNDPAKPEVQRLAQVYHDAYRAAHQDCPTLGKAEFAGLKRVLTERPFDRVAAVLCHGVRSEDAYLTRRGHKLLDLLSNFQGIAQALDAGCVHGATMPKAPSRRQPIATADQFTETGEVKL